MHTYVVIDTHDPYRKILLLIANTILNRRKNTEYDTVVSLWDKYRQANVYYIVGFVLWGNQVL